MTRAKRKPIRILLIAEHLIIRAGLRLLLESHPGFVVVGEAGARADALAVATREKADIILLDVDFSSHDSGLDLMSGLLSVAGDARVLLLTGVRDPEVHQRAVRVGAMGLVFKEKPPDDLFKAIEKVYAGEVWLDRSLTARVLTKMVRSNDTKQIEPETNKATLLTEREREVVTLVSEGLKNKDIAERLFISETTVRHHLTSIFSKLDVASRFELIILLHQQKLARTARY
jgi:two-component system nitrate/nitrite response regulator NarL